MDEQKYKAWWPLHLKVALGEALSVEEQRIYNAGCEYLAAEEQAELLYDPSELQALQAELRELTLRNQEFVKEESLLREQLAQLEKRYFVVTGKTLGLEI